MNNNFYLNKLKKALNSRFSNKNQRHKCVAYANINGKKYFAVSGASVDYDDTYPIMNWKQKSDCVI